MTTTTRQTSAGRFAVSVWAAAFLLAACGPADDEPEDPRGATSGVLRTDDLGRDWSGPWWGIPSAQHERDPDGPPFALGCDVPVVPSGAAGGAGRTAYASAAWSTGEHGEVVAWSQAARYDDASHVDEVLTSIDVHATGCTTFEPSTTGGGTSVSTLTGTPEAPVIDEIFMEDTPRAWHIRTTWTTTDDDIVVMLTIGWRPGHEPHLDHQALLDTAVERAATLPETTNDPWPS